MPWQTGPEIRCERVAKLNQKLHLDFTVITDPKNVLYFTGFATARLAMPTYLFVTSPDPPRIFTGETAKDVVERKFGGDILTYPNYDLNERMIPYPDFVAREASTLVFPLLEGRRIGIDSWNMPYILLRALSDAFPQCQFVDVSGEFRNMRMVKDPDEIDAIRKSCQLNDFAYEVARDTIAEGLSEVEVYAQIHSEVVKKVGSFQFFSGDFVSGERSLEMGGPPSNRKLSAGDTFILDLWVTTDGYWSDTARTFFVGGNPSDSQKALLEVARKALASGREKLVPGSTVSEVYRAVFGIMKKAGYGGRFPHHAGHGIGLDGQEAPFFIPGVSDKLKNNMVCTLEPGIYLPGVGGLRIEENYLITEEGPETLTSFPLNP